ncbi:MAG: hypothetical protein AT718_06100 [Vulcanisaeta sp. JCHS_4]|nr:MAG: hypothetical protein AT718_06100 [Vulcanisaeta sp. JCHS_4]
MHWGLVAFYPRSVRDLFLRGLGAGVVVGSLSVEFVDGGGSFTVRVGLGELVSTDFKGLRDLVSSEPNLHLFTAVPARLAGPLFFMLERFGFVRFRVHMVNADPTVVPIEAGGDADVLRNIAYIHAVHRFITVQMLKRRLRLHGSKVAATTHAILARSNYNADKNLIQRHIKPETMRMLPRVTLA